MSAAPLLESPLDAYLKQYSELGVALPSWAVDLMRECTRLAVAAYNSNVMAQNGDPQTTALAAFAKSVPGLGTRPGFAPASYEWPDGDSGPEIAAGPEQYGLKVPRMKAQLSELLSEDIAALSVFYNEHFGIEPSDRGPQQRRKLARFFGVRSDHDNGTGPSCNDGHRIDTGHP